MQSTRSVCYLRCSVFMYALTSDTTGTTSSLYPYPLPTPKSHLLSASRSPSNPWPPSVTLLGPFATVSEPESPAVPRTSRYQPGSQCGMYCPP